MFPVILLVVVMLNQVYAPFIRLPGGLAPDLALLVAVCAGLTYAPVGAAWLGFTAGLIQESLTGGLLGVGALSKGLIGLVWTPLWRQKVSDAPLLQLPLLVGLTILDGAIFFCTCRLFSSPAVVLGYLFSLTLAAAPVKSPTWAVSAHVIRGHSSQADAHQAFQPETPCISDHIPTRMKRRVVVYAC